LGLKSARHCKLGGVMMIAEHLTVRNPFDCENSQEWPSRLIVWVVAKTREWCDSDKHTNNQREWTICLD
jgi:hypothetical protein